MRIHPQQKISRYTRQKHLDQMHFQNMQHSNDMQLANNSEKIIIDDSNKLIQYQSVQQYKKLKLKDDDANKSDNQQIDISAKKIQKKESQIIILSNNSKQKLKLNNYFGSKTQIQRLPQSKTNLVNQFHPQNSQIDNLQQSNTTNNILTKLVKMQIQQKKQWQDKRNYQQLSLASSQSDRISNNSAFNKNSSTNLLKKINDQKFLGNIQKNILDENKQQDLGSYIIKQKNPQQEQDSIIKIEKRKKALPKLNPLKTRPSTLQVLNELQFLKIDSKKQPSSTKQIKKSQAIGSLIGSLKRFNTEQIKKGQSVIGQIYRNNQGLCNRLFPIYNFHLQDKTYIISAQKTMSGYTIFSDQNELDVSSPNFLGQLKGNLLGTVYNLYQANKKDQILATYVYNSDFSTNSVARDLSIYVKNRNLSHLDLQREDIQNLSSNLQQLYHQGENMIQKKIVKYTNLQPIFCQNTKRYILDLGLKSVIPSVKNSIIINPDSPQQKLIVVAKIGDNSLYLRAENPFDMLTVIGYLMSSYNFKLLTQ